VLTAIVITVYVITLLLDFLPSLREWALKERFVYLAFLAISFCVLILFSLDIKVPGPTGAIRAVVGHVFPK
jgi:hypothetical protein